MTLNQRQLAMLRSLQHRPRTAREFTHGDHPVAPAVVLMYLDAMEEAGYIEQSASGLYSITRLGEVFLHNQPEVASPQTWGPLSTTGTYTPPKWSVRQGGNDHQQCRSKTSFVDSEAVSGQPSTAGEV